MGELLPAKKSLCWRQNLEVVSKELKRSSKTKSNRAAPAHTRSEVRRKIGRDNAAERVVFRLTHDNDGKVLNEETGLSEKIYGAQVLGAPIGSGAFERSWLATKAGEICSSVYKNTKVLSYRSSQATHSVTYYSPLSLADFVAATNRPSQTALFRAKIDVALRHAYAAVVDVDVLEPSGHDANLHEDPAFTRDLFGLKINQGGGGFRPYSERVNFLNCMNNILPQMLNMVPKEGDTKRAFGPLSQTGSARIRSAK
jgi:hypothetical protein